MWHHNLGRTTGPSFGWIFWTMTFYDLKKFTSRSFYYEGSNIDIFWKTVDFGLFKTISEFQNLLCFDLGNCNLTLSKGSFDYFHTGTKSWHVIMYLPRSLFWIEYMKVILIDVSIPRNKLETSEKLKGFQGWFNNKNLTIAWKREEIHFMFLVKNYFSSIKGPTLHTVV